MGQQTPSQVPSTSAISELKATYRNYWMQALQITLPLLTPLHGHKFAWTVFGDLAEKCI